MWNRVGIHLRLPVEHAVVYTHPQLTGFLTDEEDWMSIGRAARSNPAFFQQGVQLLPALCKLCLGHPVLAWAWWLAILVNEINTMGDIMLWHTWRLEHIRKLIQ